MRFKNSLLLVLFCFPLLCQAAENAMNPLSTPCEVESSSPQSLSLASLEGEPNAFVGRCVNAISGQYCEYETDLISYGHDPLMLERSYCGAVDIAGNFCAGWSLNHEGYLEVESGKFVSHKKQLYGSKIHLKQEFGYPLEFEALHANERRAGMMKQFHLQLEGIKGIANTSHGPISGRTNIKNMQVSLEEESKVAPYYILHAGSGSRKFYKSRASGDRYYLMEEVKPNGNMLQYPRTLVTADKNKKRPVLTLANSKGQLLHSIFKEKAGLFKEKKFSTEDGRHVAYTMKQISEDASLLTRVERSEGPVEEYKYKLV